MCFAASWHYLSYLCRKSFSFQLKYKGGCISQLLFFLALKCICIHFHPTSGDACYYRVDFHFVSDEGGAVEAQLNMPRGLEWDWCLVFRGKQTHTGSRHGCHISLSSPVTPEGSGQGQPLCSGDASKNLHVLSERIHNQTHARIVCGADTQMRQHMLHLFWLLNKLSKIQQN